MFNTNPFREHRATVDAVEEVLGEKKKLDPVDKDELKGTHADREDGDIDNDGDEDDADKFLHKKRKAISKSMKKKNEKDEVVMNPKVDDDKSAPVEAKESRIRKSLRSVLEGSREEHNKGAIPAQDAKENRKGKGAEEMMKPADDAIANPALDEPDRIKKDAAKMTANVPATKKRPQDKGGEEKVIAPGTPMKDPAAMKKESSDHTLSNIANAYKSMYEKEENLYHRNLDEGMFARMKSNKENHLSDLEDAAIHHSYVNSLHMEKEKMLKGHKGDPDDFKTPEHENSHYLHSIATDAHQDAHDAIRAFQDHLSKKKDHEFKQNSDRKRNSLGHFSGEDLDHKGRRLHKAAQEASAAANMASRRSGGRDRFLQKDFAKQDKGNKGNTHQDLKSAIRAEVDDATKNNHGRHHLSI